MEMSAPIKASARLLAASHQERRTAHQWRDQILEADLDQAEIRFLEGMSKMMLKYQCHDGSLRKMKGKHESYGYLG
jgi:hypothetical protein